MCAGFFPQAIRKAPTHAAVGFRQAVRVFGGHFIFKCGLVSLFFCYRVCVRACEEETFIRIVHIRLCRDRQANKLLVITQLLMGEIPERALFRQPDLSRSLRPYLALTQVRDACYLPCVCVCVHSTIVFLPRDLVPAWHNPVNPVSSASAPSFLLPCTAVFHILFAQAVRVGDLAAFAVVMTEHGAKFKADKTFTLVQRCVGLVVGQMCFIIVFFFSSVDMFAPLRHPKVFLCSCPDTCCVRNVQFASQCNQDWPSSNQRVVFAHFVSRCVPNLGPE